MVGQKCIDKFIDKQNCKWLLYENGIHNADSEHTSSNTGSNISPDLWVETWLRWCEC